jgi:hypothetical protein
VHDRDDPTELSDKSFDPMVCQDIVLWMTPKDSKAYSIICRLGSVTDGKKYAEGEAVIGIIQGQRSLGWIAELFENVRWESFIGIVQRSASQAFNELFRDANIINWRDKIRWWRWIVTLLHWRWVW